MNASAPTVIAIGGNALIHEGEAGSLTVQRDRAGEFGSLVASLVAEGRHVTVTHGNGPQVGYILRRGELAGAEASAEGLPELPLWLAVADSQGGIGHLLALGIDSALEARGLQTRAVAVLTHCEVDPTDRAFAEPTKPIGGVLDAVTAARRAQEDGWEVREVNPGVFRRVVASPPPLRVVESAQVRALMGNDAVVIAAGGGGIPVVRDPHGWHPVDAVIDKDRASALLARDLGASTLVLVTAVDQVYVDFGMPSQRALAKVDPATMREHLASGQFPPGSMGPKIAAALEFVEHSAGTAIITSLAALPDALHGRAGTQLIATPAPPHPKEMP